jgi:hypothetical protein
MMADLPKEPDPAAALRELHAEIGLLEQRMTIKFGAMIAAWVVFVIAAQKLF